MSIPHVKFGICERCGRGGTSLAGTVQESGYELKDYQGKVLCALCIIELTDRHVDGIRNTQDQADEQFRQSAGVEQA